MKDTSQYGEATEILKYFAGRDPKTLRFLDIGANDGVSNSNTAPLREAGWSGVMVEPCPQDFARLMHNTLDSNVALVNAAVVVDVHDAYPAIRLFHVNTLDGISSDQLSTLEQSHVERCKGYPFRKIWINPVTLVDLIEVFQGPFQFVNIDVEGTNAAVCKRLCRFIADGALKVEMACVENDHPSIAGELRTVFKEHSIIGGNVLAWSHK